MSKSALWAVPLVFAMASHAATIRVPADSPTIQAGIDASVSGDTVLVAPGTYEGVGNYGILNRGRGIALLSEGGPEVTVLKGDEPNHIITCTAVEGEDDLEIAGFTMSGGKSQYGSGIAIWNFTTTTTVRNCILSENESVNYGVLYVGSSTAIIENCVLSSNVEGGSSAIWINEYNNGGPSDVTMTGCKIVDNEGQAGGVVCHSSSLRMSECEISRNTASDRAQGAGVRLLYATDVSIENCTLAGNSGGYGGGLYATYCDMVTLEDCAITGNDALAHFGGGIVVDNSGYSLTRCTISDNEAGSNSGGFRSADSDGVITNCVISGNRAGEGGGLLCIGSNTEIMNCTITGNSAVSRGGGLYSYDDAKPIITNSILWANDPSQVEGRGPVVTFCDVEGGFEGEGNIEWDPQLMDLAGGDYHLSSGSPCIDAGTSHGAPDTDYEGDERPQGRGFDIGADEALAACDLAVELSDYPATIARGSRLVFRASAVNDCDDPLTLDQAVLSVAGPARLEISLYDGAPIPIRKSAGTDVKLSVPPTAPLGTYAITVTIYRDGGAIDSESFDVSVVDEAPPRGSYGSRPGPF